MTLPLLGIIAGPTDTAEVAPLVVALRSWCRPHALDPSLGPPAALLATSTAAIGLNGALAGSVPVVVISNDPGPIPHEVRARAAAVVVRDDLVADELGDQAIRWHRDAVAASEHPCLSPFVRERWRRRLSLPSTFIVEIGTQRASDIAHTNVAATLAVCSAAVVRGPWLTTALALGTAVVTDATSAARLGATPAVHLAVAGPHDATATAHALANDPARAAALGWGGRLLVEAHLDSAGVALEIAHALGIGPRDFPAAPLSRLDAELGALGTPTNSSVANRALRRAVAIAGVADWADLTGRRQ